MGAEDARVIELQGQIEAANARVNEFISTVAHELRTPLTSIRGSLGLLGAESDLAVEAKELVVIAERNVVRLIDMLNTLVDLDRIESGEGLQLSKAAVDVLVEGAVELVEALADEHDVTIDVGGTTDARLLADVERLERAIGQLLSNAVQFSSPDSHVEVTTEVDGATLLLKVIDRGRGIPGPQQAGIFDRYRQAVANAPRPKKGLGLAFAQAVVERHNGTIGVESIEGKGSTFWVRLPLLGA